MEEFNLLVSSARGNEKDANTELHYLLAELGDNSAKTGLTPVSGLTVAKTGLDPVQVTSRLRAILYERPWEFRYVLKIKPVQRVVKAEIGEISEVVSREAGLSIAENETFRVTVEKRHNKTLVTRDVIDAVAKQVPRKVDLHNPSRIVMIEILNDLAGVAIVKPDAVLGVEREKKRSPQTATSCRTRARRTAR